MTTELTSPKSSRSVEELLQIIGQVMFWEVVSAEADSGSNPVEQQGQDQISDTGLLA